MALYESVHNHKPKALDLHSWSSEELQQGIRVLSTMCRRQVTVDGITRMETPEEYASSMQRHKLKQVRRARTQRTRKGDN